MHKIVDRPGVAAEIFGALGQHGVNVELISTNSLGRKRADVSFAVLESDLDAVSKLLEAIKDKFGAQRILIDKDCAMITIYGSQLATKPGIAGKIFAKLSEHGINIDMISASLSVLTIVIKKDKMTEAVQVINREFLN